MKTILFVCTGNTCRSPMAMVYANSFAKSAGLEITADSAGIFADGNSKYSGGAVASAKKAGLVLNGVSKQVTKDLLQNADYIVGITQSHSKAIIQNYPEFANKIYCFPCDVPDPFGGNSKAYDKCFEEIKKGVDNILMFLSAGPCSGDKQI